jgi:branched-chain amino acid transport system permease protein
MIASLLAATPRRALVLLALLLGTLIAAPLVFDRYLVSVLILVLWFAYVGQAWNVMMGFAGLLSLGHALYVGLGAYITAGLFVRLGIGPLAGLPVAMAAAVAVGGAIGWLGFRFRIEGVYFALLTIAFAEVTRIAFDHLAWTGGAAGLRKQRQRHMRWNPPGITMQLRHAQIIALHEAPQHLRED